MNVSTVRDGVGSLLLLPKYALMEEKKIGNYERRTLALAPTTKFSTQWPSHIVQLLLLLSCSVSLQLSSLLVTLIPIGFCGEQAPGPTPSLRQPPYSGVNERATTRQGQAETEAFTQ